MSRWGLIAITVVLAASIVGVSAILVGGALWRRATGDAVARLPAVSDSLSRGPPPSGAWDSAALPPPVARYFDLVLPDGPQMIRNASVHWKGEMRLRPDAGWVPFTAVQEFTARPPGFVWDAAVRMLPLVPVRVRDHYGGGEGSMHGRIGGVIPVVDVGGTPEIAQSALIRWIGEAVWFPSALLPAEVAGTSVSWTAIDDLTAAITVIDGPVHATAEFQFNPDGTMAGMTALRFRDVGGTPVPTPFEGVYSDWGRRDGFLVPLSAEVAWLLPEGRFAYWRGSPVEVQYRLEQHVQ